MAYRKKAKKAGFLSHCSKQLKSVKLARSAGTRSKSTLRYQKCLAQKGIKSGAGKVKKKGNKN